MTETPTDVVSEATEAAPSGEPSSLEPQTEGASNQEQPQATTQPTEPPKETPDWRKRQREDAELNAHIQSEIAKARTRWQRQQLRATAQHAAQNEDADSALHVARQIAQEQDEPEEGEVRSADWARAADRVQPQLERLLQINKDGQATNPYYVRLHQQVGRAEMDKKYAEDPAGFVNWVDDQIMEMRVDEKLKKVAPALARGMATDEVHKQLRGMGTPLTGGAAGGGALTLEKYSADPALRRKLQSTPEGRAQIDAMMSRASSG